MTSSTGRSADPQTARGHAVRAHNLVVCTVLFFIGLGFGTVVFSGVENDFGDRLDDIGLLVVGLAALVWYLVGDNRYRRSMVPAGLAVLAMLAELLALGLETDDPAAFGDNIGALIIVIPFAAFAAFHFWRTGRLLAEIDRAAPTQNDRGPAHPR